MVDLSIVFGMFTRGYLRVPFGNLRGVAPWNRLSGLRQLGFRRLHQRGVEAAGGLQDLL